MSATNSWDEIRHRMEEAGLDLSHPQSMDKKILRGLATEFVWGTYGKDGTKISYKPFTSLSTDHIRNILITQAELGPECIAVFLAIYEERLEEIEKSFSNDSVDAMFKEMAVDAGVKNLVDVLLEEDKS